jgi:hypothetical protein
VNELTADVIKRRHERMEQLEMLVAQTTGTRAGAAGGGEDAEIKHLLLEKRVGGDGEGLGIPGRNNKARDSLRDGARGELIFQRLERGVGVRSEGGGGGESLHCAGELTDPPKALGPRDGCLVRLVLVTRSRERGRSGSLGGAAAGAVLKPPP